MSEKITIHMVGKDGVYVREIEYADPAVPQYRDLSPTKRETYHYSGTDQHGILIYELMGTEERTIPSVSGDSR